ncbi:hypothetical protein SCUCBS95973_003295 [Sporothrix curviconia]|uniref:Transcription factor domain-containing protein n=1 Tax=Sporothrix curviconia TaxID=1260050 RepID=A0ABP0BF55_9PEZI
MNYPRRRAPIALCSGAGISCDYQEVHPGHGSPRHDEGGSGGSSSNSNNSNNNTSDNSQSSSSSSANASSTMAEMQRMLGQLESEHAVGAAADAAAEHSYTRAAAGVGSVTRDAVYTGTSRRSDNSRGRDSKHDHGRVTWAAWAAWATPTSTITTTTRSWTQVSPCTHSVHGAIYLCCLDRPLPAWALVHMASIKLQTIVVQLKGHPLPRDATDYVVRLCWTCFLLECDALAEFHLPRSGMELIIDSMPFPSFSEADTGHHDDAGRSGMMFLALCSIRRLLNRVHKTVYDANYNAVVVVVVPAAAPKPHRHHRHRHDLANSMSLSLSAVTSTATPPMAAVCPLWPPSMSMAMTTPDMAAASLSLGGNPHANPQPPAVVSVRLDLDTRLRLRYWSAKHIICRPCLVFAASYRLPEGYPSTPGLSSGLPDYVLHLSQTCIEGCRQYILMAAYQLRERTQYTWMTMQSALACAFVITIAARCPLLRFLVPDAAGLLQQVLVSTQRWATPGSSAESISWNEYDFAERAHEGGIAGGVDGEGGRVVMNV